MKTKPPSRKQVNARIRNFCIFRLKGCLAQIKSVSAELAGTGSKVGSADIGCAMSDIQSLIEKVKKEKV